MDGLQVWVAFSDSANMHMGVGTRENYAGDFMSARTPGSPLEWRGVMEDGRFRPFAVIVRYVHPGERSGTLAVLGLSRDRTSSCLLGEETGPDQNRRARERADRVAGHGCG